MGQPKSGVKTLTPGSELAAASLISRERKLSLSQANRFGVAGLLGSALRWEPRVSMAEPELSTTLWVAQERTGGEAEGGTATA